MVFCSSIVDCRMAHYQTQQTTIGYLSPPHIQKNPDIFKMTNKISLRNGRSVPAL